MPNKICTKCQKPSGVRTLVCVCGHVFRKPKEELNQVTVTEVKEVVTEPALTLPKPAKDADTILKEQAELLSFTTRAGEVYKFLDNHKYYAIVSSSGKITGVQRCN